MTSPLPTPRPPSEQGVEYQLLDAITALNARLDLVLAEAIPGLRVDVAATLRDVVGQLATHPNTKANLEQMIEERLIRTT